MAQKTVIEKMLRQVKKKIRVTAFGFRPSALKGRMHGPKVLLNSIPKAGTNLLENTLMRMPLLRNAGLKTITAPYNITPDDIKRIISTKRGQFVNGHIPYYKELEDALRENNIRMLFMIRDPRDVVVSWFKYVCSIDRVHIAHQYIKSLDHDHDRLMAAINGVPNVVEPIGDVLDKYSKWLESDVCLICRFEDLIGLQGGGSDLRQQQLVRNIFNFLEVNISEDDLIKLSNGIYSKKASTFNKGIIGSWKNNFNEEHVNQFKLSAGKELIYLGYESTINW